MQYAKLKAWSVRMFAFRGLYDSHTDLVVFNIHFLCQVMTQSLRHLAMD